MKFTVAALFAILASASAYEGFHVVKRQSQSLVTDVSQAAMTDRSGNVVPFDSKNVYQDAKERGL
ncbi:hypothetical protein V8F20_001786 [Naviculisporaceae sp. PSN 640]